MSDIIFFITRNMYAKLTKESIEIDDRRRGLKDIQERIENEP